MSRPAARQESPAPRGRVVALVVLVLLTAVSWGGAGVPSATAAPGDAVEITVTGIDPPVLTPDAEVVVTGTVTNALDVAIRDPILRLQRGPLLDSRAELAANDADPSVADTAYADFIDLAVDIPARRSVSFSYRTDAAALGLFASGVYPVLVNVNGTPDGDVVQRVGEVDTLLPFFATPPERTTGVGWVWPLVDRPHRDAAGVFLDDTLAQTVAGGGRLERLLGIAEQAVGAQLTLAVDPLLVQELQAMAAGYRLADGSTGGGTAAAQAWLARLRAVAQVHPVLALPYADVDLEALVAAGLTGEVEAALTRGRSALADLLGRTPEVGLAWPPDGTLGAATADVLRAGGVDTVVLDPTGVERSPSDGLVGASATVTTGDTTLSALVSDGPLDSVVAAAARWPTGPRLAVQRYLAELAVLSVAATGPTTVLVVPPRRFDPQATYALPMLTLPAGEAWLAGADLSALQRTVPVDRGDLVAPTTPEAGLDGAGTATLTRAVRAVSDLRSMLVLETPEEEQTARDLLDPLGGLTLAAASTAWRGVPGEQRAWADRADAAVQQQRRRVFLIVPADGMYSLASANAPLVFTVENQLPLPVQVRISVDSRLVAGLSTDEIGPQLVGPAGRTLIEVPATVERPGEFRVTAAIYTPAGGTLGEPVLLTVRSTVYGGIALGITAVAGGLLVLLLARRLIRRIRQGRRPPPAAGPTLSAAGASAAGTG